MHEFSDTTTIGSVMAAPYLYCCLSGNVLPNHIIDTLAPWTTFMQRQQNGPEYVYSDTTISRTIDLGLWTTG